MHRKLTQNLISLSAKDFNKLGDCVSMSVVNSQLIIMPYQVGDENREGTVIRTLDARRRVLIPSEFVRLLGIDAYVDIVIEHDTTIYITPLNHNKIDLRRKNTRL